MAERIPPHNNEAEQAVLGAMLLDKETISRVVEILRADCFYNDSHRFIFQAIISLYEDNKPIDMVTVADNLRKNKQLDSIGGSVYLTDILDAIPTASNVEYYARLVDDASILRNMITTGSELVTMAFDPEQEVGSVLENAQRKIFDIAKNRVQKSFTDLKSVLLPVMNKIEESYGKDEVITGVPSDFADLDYLTSGFQKSDMIILAARPSMGKTSFALNIAANVAVKHKIPTAIFSLEMSKEQLAFRLLCSESGIDSHRLKTANLKDHEHNSLAKNLGKLGDAPIFIDDTASLSCLEMKAKARRLALEENIGLVIIDYLQLINGGVKSENRTQEISSIARALKALARDLNVPVIALSQLSRGVEQRIDKTPRLSDLRESGEIEQTADIVMFIHREDYYDSAVDNKNQAQIIVAKHRNGPTGKVDLVFKKEITKFLPKERFTHVEG
ncbi:MAG: replicative DNA helicase [Candidatus Margulisiibacteriota bacterium]